MNALYTAISLFQFASIFYCLIIGIENSRAFTLAKNSSWVRENRSFLEQHRKPSPVFWGILFLASALWFSVVSLNGSYLSSSKMIAVFVPVIIGGVVFAVKEKSIDRAIPEQSLTTASLTYRSLENYVNRPMKIAMNTLLVLPIALTIVLFVSGKIGTDLFMYNLNSILIFLGISYGALVYQIKQKLPHDSELQEANRHQLSESYRTISVKILSWALVVVAIALLSEQIVQLFGFVFSPDPLLHLCQKKFGSETVVTPLLTEQMHDLIISAVSIPLFILIARLKPMQDVRSTRLFK